MPGIWYPEPARHCTQLEIKYEVWAQITRHLSPKDNHALSQAKILYWYLDPTIVTDPPPTRNLEPLLTNNTVNSWAARPEVDLGIPNLSLAGDYVRTNTDLATMEGANEAARRAVKHVLEVFGEEGRCEVWELREPRVVGVLRWLDMMVWWMGWRNVFDS